MEFLTVANPTFIPLAFAENGLRNVIQKTRQPSQDPQDMTLNDGSPLITLTPIENGGKAPKGQDFNGIMHLISSHTIFGQNGNRYKWSADVVTNFGGYAKDSIVQSDDGLREYVSLIDNNATNPNSSVTGAWSIYAGNGSVPTATSTVAGIMTVINNLTSTNVGSALSAAMGKRLQDIFNRFSLQPSINGYAKIPFGNDSLTIQWGVFKGNGSNIITGNFPTAYQSGAFISIGNFSDGSQNLSVNVNFEHVGLSQWRASVSNNNPTFRYSYISIGQ